MKKPNISINDLITKRTSVLLNISEDIVSAVMSYEKRSVKEALNKYNTVEISNLGTFSIREKKLIKEYESQLEGKGKFLDKIEEVTPSIQRKLTIIDSYLQFLKTKLENAKL